MFDHTDTTVVLVDYDKGRFVVEAEQLSGKRIVVATETSWECVKKHLADARVVHYIPARCSNRAKAIVKKQIIATIKKQVVQ